MTPLAPLRSVSPALLVLASACATPRGAALRALEQGDVATARAQLEAQARSGVPEDHAAGLAWLERAAEQGFAPARTKLAPVAAR